MWPTARGNARVADGPARWQRQASTYGWRTDGAEGVSTIGIYHWYLPLVSTIGIYHWRQRQAGMLDVRLDARLGLARNAAAPRACEVGITPTAAIHGRHMVVGNQWSFL